MPNLSNEADKRGYLTEPFRLFHLKESRARHFSYHYHEFDKVVIFLSGQVTYTIEGKAYLLSPGDVLLVPHHHIHQPDIGCDTYERYILWLQPGFLAEEGLDLCCRQAAETGFHLIRPEPQLGTRLRRLLELLEQALSDRQFGHQLLSRTLCQQLMIYLNRAQQGNQVSHLLPVYESDPKIEEILTYINTQLSQPMTVQDLADRFYLSSSWLMHRFKEVTGCSVHQYILQKRLILAAGLIKAGTPVMKAAAQSGFSDYSSFLRAFRNTYHTSPKNYKE